MQLSSGVSGVTSTIWRKASPLYRHSGHQIPLCQVKRGWRVLLETAFPSSPALPDGSVVHQPEPRLPEQINESEPPQDVDADKVLADFSQYASKENDGVKLKARYEETWKLLNGFAEHQAKCKDVTGIRIRELKQAA